MYFVTCLKQGLEMEAVVLQRVGCLEYFCPKQGQDFKPSAAPLYPNMGQVPSTRDFPVVVSGICKSFYSFMQSRAFCCLVRRQK